MLDELNPTISQLEHERVQHDIEVVESYNINVKCLLRVSFAKLIIKKSLEQVLRSYPISFDLMVTLPPGFSYEDGKIKSFKLFEPSQKRVQ